jgi:hypothetical protein
MSFEPPQRSIWLCNRDLEGRKNKCTQGWCMNQIPKRKDLPPHWFLIISRKSTQGFVTALPITSQEYQEKLNEGEEIKKSDVKVFSKSKNSLSWYKPKTLVLCNKPCRIPIDDFKENNDWGMLDKTRYDHVTLFAKDCFTRKN